METQGIGWQSVGISMIQIVLFAALMIVIVAAIFLAAKVMNKIEPGKDREA